VNFVLFMIIIDTLFLLYFIYSYYLIHEVEVRKNVLSYIFHTLMLLHLLPSTNHLNLFFIFPRVVILTLQVY